MKTGNQNLKNNKKIIEAVFLSLFFMYFIYCVCIIPSYLLERSMGYVTQPWASIKYKLHTSFIGPLFSWLYYKIPDFTAYSCIFDKCRKYGFGICTLQEKVVVLSLVGSKHSVFCVIA